MELLNLLIALMIASSDEHEDAEGSGDIYCAQLLEQALPVYDVEQIEEMYLNELPADWMYRGH